MYLHATFGIIGIKFSVVPFLRAPKLLDKLKYEFEVKITEEQGVGGMFLDS
jgi:hypothetical protein